MADHLGIHVADINFFQRMQALDSIHAAAKLRLEHKEDPTEVIKWLRLEYRHAHDDFPIRKAQQ
jgi:hypothetical protein